MAAELGGKTETRVMQFEWHWLSVSPGNFPSFLLFFPRAPPPLSLLLFPPLLRAFSIASLPIYIYIYVFYREVEPSRELIPIQRVWDIKTPQPLIPPAIFSVVQYNPNNGNILWSFIYMYVCMYVCMYIYNWLSILSQKYLRSIRWVEFYPELHPKLIEGPIEFELKRDWIQVPSLCMSPMNCS